MVPGWNGCPREAQLRLGPKTTRTKLRPRPPVFSLASSADGNGVSLSVSRLVSLWPAGTNVTVSWQSVAGVNYFLERSTNLWGSPTFTLLAPSPPGQPGTTTYTDTNAPRLFPLFYRVGVGP
jgi:hypothetical protein